MSERDRLVGLRRLPQSWQVYLTYRGKFISRTFPLDTPVSTMKAWRERTRASLAFGTYRSPKGRTFAEDAETYLGLIEHMPSVADRQYHIQQWTDVFGPRVRSSLTAADIAAQLARWRVNGRFDGKGLSPASLNRRRTALMAMFTALDGRAAPNIVKDVPAFDERESERDRARPLLVLAQIIRHLRPWHLTRVRLHVLMWTGWPASILMRLTPADFDWTHGLVRVSWRRKGKGMPAAWVPVLPRALAALRRLEQRGGLGAFSTSSMHSAWARALQAENLRRARHELPPLPHIRVYDLKHSFATYAASRIRDDRALMSLLRTGSIRRYTGGAEAERLQIALQGFARFRPAPDVITRTYRHGKKKRKSP